MTIAQKIAELAEALGVDIPNDGQIADNLNAITLAKGGTITSNTNISEAIKNLANTIGGNDGGNDSGNSGIGLTPGFYISSDPDVTNGNEYSTLFVIDKNSDMYVGDIITDIIFYSGEVVNDADVEASISDDGSIVYESTGMNDGTAHEGYHISPSAVPGYLFCIAYVTTDTTLFSIGKGNPIHACVAMKDSNNEYHVRTFTTIWE